MTLFLPFVFIAAIVRTIERTLFHTYKWQLKEYRFDRYRDYLRSRQGVWILLHPWYWLGCILLISSLARAVSLPMYFEYIPPEDIAYRMMRALWVAASIYIFLSGCSSLWTWYTRGVLRPFFTIRATIIVILSMLALYLLFISAPFRIFSLRFVQPMLYVSVSIAPIVALIVLLTSPLAAYFKRRTIAEAKKKMASLPNLRVIGITGSFGKSSTKEFLAMILSAKYRVCKTPKNFNSEIGVAQTILRNLKLDDEIFIVEMGAYRRGEIKAIGDIVKPTIGVLTAVNEQHLALFGSLDLISETKYELIEALPENGIAVFNGDNRITRELAERTLKPTKIYSTERPADVTATAVTVQPEKLSFSVHTEKEKQHFSLPLLGHFHVSNLLAAMTVAETLGMTLREIGDILQNMEAPKHSMAAYHHASGALIIDDSYSANPDGVLGALQHLKTVPRRYKVLVMMPMIELGSAGKEAHRRVGEAMRHSCDFVIMTQKNFGRILQKASDLPNQKFLFLSSPKGILNALAPYVNANSVILLENRVPTAVVKSLTTSSV